MTPRTRKAKSAPLSPVDLDQEGWKLTLKLILDELGDAKAEDTLTIDLAGKSAMADALVVTSGRSNRQVGAIADRLEKALREAGIRGVKIEGLPHCDWVVLDAGDVIVHIFRPEVRAFYNLEKMWAPEMARRVS
ncbi:ribosome silencing factor [Variibacter gotjawalensis]|uniref:ribosome silencing factor n=1 Tax=Variibacter gotjawalensis TaxID=1333996 RepID=UPI001DD95087|nr:ribosome-associated protein [Variibacter gotjawalensis]